jgi:hypothetical protein
MFVHSVDMMDHISKFNVIFEKKLKIKNKMDEMYNLHAYIFFFFLNCINIINKIIYIITF